MPKRTTTSATPCASWAQANALTLAVARRRGQGYDPSEHARFVSSMIATCTPAFFERVRDFGLECERPIFIFGLPRSGTTLTEQILASHSQDFGAGELRLARDDFEALAPQADAALDALAREVRVPDRRSLVDRIPRAVQARGTAPLQYW